MTVLLWWLGLSVATAVFVLWPRKRPTLWAVTARGGIYDGWTAETVMAPGPVLIIWVCGDGCAGHATFDRDRPEIVLGTAESYRQVKLDVDDRIAVYEIGDGSPDDGPDGEQQHKAALADLGSGWPVSR